MSRRKRICDSSEIVALKNARLSVVGLGGKMEGLKNSEGRPPSCWILERRALWRNDCARTRERWARAGIESMVKNSSPAHRRRDEVTGTWRNRKERPKKLASGMENLRPTASHANFAGRRIRQLTNGLLREFHFGPPAGLKREAGLDGRAGRGGEGRARVKPPRQICRHVKDRIDPSAITLRVYAANRLLSRANIAPKFDLHGLLAPPATPKPQWYRLAKSGRRSVLRKNDRARFPRGIRTGPPEAASRAGFAANRTTTELTYMPRAVHLGVRRKCTSLIDNVDNGLLPQRVSSGGSKGLRGIRVMQVASGVGKRQEGRTISAQSAKWRRRCRWQANFMAVPVVNQSPLGTLKRLYGGPRGEAGHGSCGFSWCNNVVEVVIDENAGDTATGMPLSPPGWSKYCPFIALRNDTSRRKEGNAYCG
ncbi:hypothetical protein KM043_004193 [Ampulex compressa]|nr:hypothetical protein KM043_004193 [Ampulex compressa]